MESVPTLSTPEAELAYLREQVSRKEAELAEPNAFEHVQIISETIHEHHQAPAEVLASEYRLSEATKEIEAEAILAELNLGTGADAIDHLRRTMEEKGVKNALAVAEKLGDPHLVDDFHRYLVRYIAAGISAPGLD